MPIPVSSIGVIYALAFLLPGFLTYKITRYVGKIIHDIDRFDKTVYTVGASAFCLVIALLAYEVAVITLSIGPQPTQNLLELGIIYLIGFIPAPALGWVIGKSYHYWLHGSDDARRQCAWDLAYDHREEPAQVRAVMMNGREIWGEMYVTDSEQEGESVILQYPQEIIRDSDGEIRKRNDLDKYVYLSGDQISEIYYETELDI